MPIKFRCSYCRQFLGISRAQAGGVVDCPTCGRSIRVPLLDGTVQPLANPELNLADAHLAKALDELAQLANSPAQKLVSQKSELPEPDEDNQIPQPLPEPIPIEVPLPPTPIVLQPPANLALNGNADEGPPIESALMSELATLAASMPSPAAGELSMKEAPEVRVRVREANPMRWTVSLLLVFVAGMVTERFIHILESLNRSKASISEQAKADAAERPLSGRITYKTKEGETLPDKGSRVIAFPQQRSGEVKLPVVGFRPADSAADQTVANAGLKALGGGAATVDDKGNFRMGLDAGSYQLLVISHYQLNENPAPNPALTKLLADYFDKPEELLGKVQYKFVPLRVKGSGDIFDHSF